MRHGVRLSAQPATGKTLAGGCLGAQPKLWRAGRLTGLIITRPAVEAGERLGFLPGDLNEKIDPYLRCRSGTPCARAADPARGRQDARGKAGSRSPARLHARTYAEPGLHRLLTRPRTRRAAQMRMMLTRLGQGSRMAPPPPPRVTGWISYPDPDLGPREPSGLAPRGGGRSISSPVWPRIAVTSFHPAHDVVRHVSGGDDRRWAYERADGRPMRRRAGGRDPPPPPSRSIIRLGRGKRGGRAAALRRFVEALALVDDARPGPAVIPADI